MRREATEWEKIFSKDTSDKSAIQNILRVFTN